MEGRGIEVVEVCGWVFFEGIEVRSYCEVQV